MPKMDVKSLEKAERDPAKLNNWIENVKNLHKVRRCRLTPG
jgi:hypothetical protein